MQALQHKVARVLARKKQANQLKRQANKKFEKRNRLLHYKQQGGTEAIASEDEPNE
jgi:hypothetical protein